MARSSETPHSPIFVRAHFRLSRGGWRETLPDTLLRARAWPEPVRPTHLAPGEGRRGQCRVESVEAERLASANEAGLYLHGRAAFTLIQKDRPPGGAEPDGCSLMTTFRRTVDGAAQVAAVEGLLRCLVQGEGPEPFLVFAGARDEFEAVHRVAVKTARGSVEGQCGLNHRRWVPWVHWRNFWHPEWLARLGLSVDSIPAAWRHDGMGAARLVVVSPFTDPFSWHAGFGTVEEWACSQRSVFCRGAVERALPRLASEEEAMEVLRTWR